jgi:hypothetical protein
LCFAMLCPPSADAAYETALERLTAPRGETNAQRAVIPGAAVTPIQEEGDAKGGRLIGVNDWIKKHNAKVTATAQEQPRPEKVTAAAHQQRPETATAAAEQQPSENPTPAPCHCGARYGGADRCPDCGCGQDAPDCGQRPSASLLTCFREATGDSFGSRLSAARQESRARAQVISARNREVLGEDAPSPGSAKEGTGFWGAVGGAFMAAAEADDRRVSKKHGRKAREHELKAGKTFRRTKKHLKKAERHQRRAGTTEATTVEGPRAAADRERAEAAKREQAQQSTTPPSLGNDVIDQLERLGKLKGQGILSDEEFQAQKAKLLDT